MTTTGRGAAALDRFNVLRDGEARTMLESCLAVPRWVDELLAGRPYPTKGAVLEQARASAAALTDAEMDAALARHPRIGERADEGHDGEFSRREQAGLGGEAALTDALVRGNSDYEARFARVFLIRAAGRTSDEILVELRRRLENDPESEKVEVVGQLGEIAVLRLEQLLDGDDERSWAP